MSTATSNLYIEDAKIMFRNFEGREQQFNSQGDRNFVVFLEPKLAETLREDGWNIKSLRPREDEDEPQQFLKVAVNYSKGRPPRCVLVSSKGKQELGADEVAIFDHADIARVDLVVNPYHWEVRENKGVKAYLKTIFVTLNEDPAELKYADTFDAAPRPSLNDNEGPEES